MIWQVSRLSFLESCHILLSTDFYCPSAMAHMEGSILQASFSALYISVAKPLFPHMMHLLSFPLFLNICFSAGHEKRERSVSKVKLCVHTLLEPESDVKQECAAPHCHPEDSLTRFQCYLRRLLQDLTKSCWKLLLLPPLLCQQQRGHHLFGFCCPRQLSQPASWADWPWSDQQL